MFKNRNLPKDATPWGREVEDRIESLENTISVLQSANIATTAQLQSTFNNTTALWNAQNSGQVITTKNFIINGGMDIWQRTGFALNQQGYVGADRWFVYTSGTNLTSYNEPTVVPIGFRYSMGLSTTGAGVTGIRQIIETTNAVYLSGKTVTVSAYVRTTGVSQLNISLRSSNEIDALSTATSWVQLAPNYANTTTAASAWTRITASFDVPENNETLMLNIEDSVAAGEVIYITGVQLETGAVATDFVRSNITYSGELAACQRYLYRYFPSTNNIGIFPSWGLIVTTTTSRFMVPLPVPMRITPTAIDISAIGDWAMAEAPSRRALSVLTIDTPGSTPTMMTLNGTHATASSAVNSVSYIAASATSTTASFIGFSAEML